MYTDKSIHPTGGAEWPYILQHQGHDQSQPPRDLGILSSVSHNIHDTYFVPFNENDRTVRAPFSRSSKKIDAGEVILDTRDDGWVWLYLLRYDYFNGSISYDMILGQSECLVAGVVRALLLSKHRSVTANRRR